ncbi:hypothetical protein A9Q94_17295 [Rhodobacterales bacterium 56_14_T64]|nr:hypothetical protein A9Q94_17295 [Rhodobacterales bacterium 56_14_T64]
MGKRANPMAVKAALTYDINEAAAAVGKTPATVRSWIKDGLPVMSSRKPYLISGEAIRLYLRAKYEAAKRPLGLNDFFCIGCGGARQPVGMAATVSPIKNRTVLLKGICSTCGSACTRRRLLMNSPSKSLLPCQEGSDCYQGEDFRYGPLRVVAFTDVLQWLIQRSTRAQRAVGPCEMYRTRNALIRDCATPNGNDGEVLLERLLGRTCQC